MGRTLKHWKRLPLKFFCHLNKSVPFCFEKATQVKCSLLVQYTFEQESLVKGSCCGLRLPAVRLTVTNFFLNTKGRPVTQCFEWLGKLDLFPMFVKSLFFSTPGLCDPVSILFQASSLALYGTLSSSTWICFTLCRKGSWSGHAKESLEIYSLS